MQDSESKQVITGNSLKQKDYTAETINSVWYGSTEILSYSAESGCWKFCHFKGTERKHCTEDHLTEQSSLSKDLIFNQDDLRVWRFFFFF